MITSWVLVTLMYYDRSSTLMSIENLRDPKECQRISKVLQDWQPRRSMDFKCIEVIKKP